MPRSDKLIPNTREPNPKPTNINARENFTAVLGLYLPSFTHNHANIGASKIINNAFKLKKLPAGMSPRSKTLSANRFKDV